MEEERISLKFNSEDRGRLERYEEYDFMVKSVLKPPEWLEGFESPFKWGLDIQAREIVRWDIPDKLNDYNNQGAFYGFERLAFLLAMILRKKIEEELEKQFPVESEADASENSEEEEKDDDYEPEKCYAISKKSVDEMATNQSDSMYNRIGPALQHVLQATRAHLLFFSGNHSESQTLARQIQLVEDMSERCKAGLEGLRAKVIMSMVQNYTIVKPYLHKAMQLDPQFGYWPYLTGKVLRRARRESIDESLASNPKSFWGFMSSLNRNRSTPRVFKHNDMTADDPTEIANLFAGYFSAIFKRPMINPPAYQERNANLISVWRLSALDIEKKCTSLDSSKGAGPGGIPPSIVKYCSNVLAPILCIFMNCFFSEGIFPSSLKSGFVIPILKAGDPSNVTNYRPVAILSAFSKIFESLVLEGLNFDLGSHIINEQHGFKKGRSTNTNLGLLQDFIVSAFSRGSQVDCVYFDFSKAFDRVSHVHLVAKLEAYGISGRLLDFLNSYLSSRSLFVKHLSALSYPIIPASGVPQGSLLGPFLFNIFINDIADTLDTQFLLFADDLKLFTQVRSAEDQAHLQTNIDRLLVWCYENAMELNRDKCSVMLYSRSLNVLNPKYFIETHTLKVTSEVRDLGVVFTPDLHPGSHIRHICAKANAALGFIARSTRGPFSISTLATLYVSLVRPLLEYCASIWNPYQLGLISALEKVQIRFIRVVGVRMGFNYLEVPISEIRCSFGLLPLSQRRLLLDSMMLFNITNGTVDCPELLEKLSFHIPRQSRFQQVFTRTQHSTVYHQNSLIPRLMRTGNDICSKVDLFGNTRQKFKREVLLLLHERDNSSRS